VHVLLLCLHARLCECGKRLSQSPWQTHRIQFVLKTVLGGSDRATERGRKVRLVCRVKSLKENRNKRSKVIKTL
jgi:hypothetical protein